MFTVYLWWIKIQEETFQLILHNVMVSTFKFGGNRRFFGVYTANFVWYRGGTRAIPLPVVSHIPVAYVRGGKTRRQAYKDYQALTFGIEKALEK